MSSRTIFFNNAILISLITPFYLSSMEKRSVATFSKSTIAFNKYIKYINQYNIPKKDINIFKENLTKTNMETNENQQALYSEFINKYKNPTKCTEFITKLSKQEKIILENTLKINAGKHLINENSSFIKNSLDLLYFFYKSKNQGNVQARSANQAPSYKAAISLLLQLKLCNLNKHNTNNIYYRLGNMYNEEYILLLKNKKYLYPVPHYRSIIYYHKANDFKSISDFCNKIFLNGGEMLATLLKIFKPIQTEADKVVKKNTTIILLCLIHNSK